jgi:hypothetical protein
MFSDYCKKLSKRDKRTANPDAPDVSTDSDDELTDADLLPLGGDGDTIKHPFELKKQLGIVMNIPVRWLFVCWVGSCLCFIEFNNATNKDTIATCTRGGTIEDMFPCFIGCTTS